MNEEMDVVSEARNIVEDYKELQKRVEEAN
jgi:hypothetical protein